MSYLETTKNIYKDAGDLWFKSQYAEYNFVELNGYNNK